MNSRFALVGLFAASTLSGCFFFTSPAPTPGASASPAAPTGSASPAPGTSPAPAASTAPGAATPTPQKPFDFNSNSSGKGIIGTIRLELGKRTFKATHDGKSNFILYITSTVPNSSPFVAFSEIGGGAWTSTLQVDKAGDYTVDLKAADGQWTVHVE